MPRNNTARTLQVPGSISRRGFLSVGLGSALVAVTGASLISCGSSPSGNGDVTDVDVQFDWLMNAQQTGEAVALSKGWYRDEGLNVKMNPGGPNVQSMGTVVGGRPLGGQMSSSDSIILAVAQGNPIKALASSYQRHPYTFFSRKSTPLNTPADLAGLTVGVQPGDGRQLLEAMLKKNGVDPSSVDIAVIGSDFSPLISGTVDVQSAWITDQALINSLEGDYNTMMLWDHGIQLYAQIYFALDKTIENNRAQLEGFLRATKKGWLFAKDNPDEALDLLFDTIADLDQDAERQAFPNILDFVFKGIDPNDWGTMQESVWNDQIESMKSVDWFEDVTPPSAADVIDLSMLPK